MNYLDGISRAIIEKVPVHCNCVRCPGWLPGYFSKGRSGRICEVLDEKYLAIPDRPGNNRVDTFTNLLNNPYLAVPSLFPGKVRRLG